jgi:peptide methionine sulfoxide reductase msrA/msrB
MHKITRILSIGLLLAASQQTLAKVDSIILGMGCFWGAEKRMAAIPGVLDVESGYAGGDAVRVGYRDVLNLERALKRAQSHQRNHAEVVKVAFDTDRVSLEQVLARFWENHDPTQGDRQGNDIGSNYRSAIYTNSPEQRAIAIRTRDAYQEALTAAGYGAITTEIEPLRNYNRAEDYHQDYLKKNPNGYCGIRGTDVAYPGQSAKPRSAALQAKNLSQERQLIVFEAEDCPYCKAFRADVLDNWSSAVPIVSAFATKPPEGWTLEKPLFATPTIVLFENGREVSRYTGYKGGKERFRKWLEPISNRSRGRRSIPMSQP